MKQEANEPIIVLGMHRSGTSLCANWLHEGGIKMGDLLAGAKPSNKQGHYEDLDFVRFHEDLLLYNNNEPQGLLKIDNDSTWNEYFLARFRSTMKYKSELNNIWGWKDPRSCLFLELYRNEIPNAKYIVMIRDYQHVVMSLLKRDWASFTKKYKSLSRAHKFIFPLKQKRLKKNIFSLHEKYLYAIFKYYQNILTHLSLISNDNFVVVDAVDFPFKVDFLQHTIQKGWGVKDFNPPNITDLFKKDQFSTNIDYTPQYKIEQDIKELELLIKNYINT